MLKEWGYNILSSYETSGLSVFIKYKDPRRQTQIQLDSIWQWLNTENFFLHGQACLKIPALVPFAMRPMLVPIFPCTRHSEITKIPNVDYDFYRTKSLEDWGELHFYMDSAIQRVKEALTWIARAWQSVGTKDYTE